MSTIDYEKLTGTHDLTLPDWGPYAFDLFTASHIADPNRGLRMDFILVPALYRRAAFPPDTLRECGFTPWEASGDFSFWSARQCIIPGRMGDTEDLCYAETSYCRVNDHFRLGRVAFVNHTQLPQQVSLYFFTRFAPRKTMVFDFPESALWLDALDYTSLSFAKPRVDEHLVWDNGRRGEEEMEDAVGGFCLGSPYMNLERKCFGENKGDSVCWRIPALLQENREYRLYIRARVDKGKTFTARFVEHNSLAAERISESTIIGTGSFELIGIAGTNCHAGTILTLKSISEGVGIRIDGLVLATAETPFEALRFQSVSQNVSPKSSEGPLENSCQIHAASLPSSYLLWWDRKAGAKREYWGTDLVQFFTYSYALRQTQYKQEYLFPQKGEEYCLEEYLTPIMVPPNETVVVHVLMGATEDMSILEDELANLDKSFQGLETIYRREHAHAFSFTKIEQAKPYVFGQQLLSATLMTNCLFPIQCRGKYIRHHSPEKYFNSLYTWDAGFIGLGLLELDIRRGVENLNAYVTEEEEGNAFVLHGTPLPVQAYLYAEIWNRTQDLAMLEHYYPRLKRYYDFIAGHDPASTFLYNKTGILTSWNYFYNSGGWDDYPPQWHRCEINAIENVAPVVTTAHVIRFAKILLRAAKILSMNGRKGCFQQDIECYKEDIQAFSESLQRYSWSEKDHIFSYVLHDNQGNFIDFWKDSVSGANYNFGFDGVSPLVSGICLPEQEEMLWQWLESPKHLWTDCGLTAVAQSAPYFKKDGYWNGSVWMPHQWFFWKAALDCGEADFARKIAMTALKIWSDEAKLSRGCYEHFSVANGRGCGCHHFGGLSAPILCWYNAYFQTGRLTGGLNCCIMEQHSREDGGITARISLEGRKSRFSTVLFASGIPQKVWKVTMNGMSVDYSSDAAGTLTISLPADAEGTLCIQ